MANADAKINRQNFQSMIEGRKWTAKEFHKRWTDRYGFTMGYNNFMELINNNVSWKLVYAFAIADMFEVQVNDIFDFSFDKIEQSV